MFFLLEDLRFLLPPFFFEDFLRFVTRFFEPLRFDDLRFLAAFFLFAIVIHPLSLYFIFFYTYYYFKMK